MSFVKIEYAQRIASITLNRPEKRNALGAELISELTEAFKEAAKYPGCKVIVLQAEGSVFCAGADLGYLDTLKANSYEENVADSSRLKSLFETIHSTNQVVIAKVEGHAIAGGCGLLTVCDLVFSVPEAKFGYTEVKIGFVPAIVAPFLVQRIGHTRTRELLLTGDLVTAETAQNYDLVNRVIPASRIADEVSAVASAIVTQNSAESIFMTKRLLREIDSLSIEQSATIGAETNARSRMGNDFKAGIAAFLEKRKIEW